MKIKKILTANRGEIALRIIRACKDMGIQTAAVYSEPDRLSPHVLLSDEAYYIGKAVPMESYLDMEKIIRTAVECGADAIHPGYGFLAENPEFARKVVEAKMIFIGPTHEAISAMGDKTVAKSIATKMGVPVVPGSEKGIESAEEAKDIATTIGYPVLLKAAAGGGGKGMRIVSSADKIGEMFRTANSEAKSSFGDGRLFVEKYIEEPHHVEFQILGDNYGKVIHLGDRECSVQRRYQKLVEESPSPTLTPELREEMGAAAVRIAEGAGYRNAGTVEFLVDGEGHYFFLEVNTRLQVEHPVTEMRTGIDLACEQIKIAAGEPLSYTQTEVEFRGSSIECRITAEDSSDNFIPTTGTVGSYIEPGGPGVRVDSGMMAGLEITPYYDPLIAKLVVWGSNRGETIKRTIRALSEYIITGLPTTIPFCLKVMRHPDFRKGRYDTRLVEKILAEQDEAPPGDEETEAAYGAAAHHLLTYTSGDTNGRADEASRKSGWKLHGREAGMR